MARILEQEQLADGFMRLKVEQANTAQCGQFYMLRGWDKYPVLSRPISIFDADDDTVSFLYRIVGKGTALLAQMQPGDTITLQGPYGNGFPAPDQNVHHLAMVGGGVGIAPLYLTAKRWKEACPNTQIDLYLGFSDKPLMVETFESVADNVTAQVGGYITDAVNPAKYDLLFTCGPEVMMRALYRKCEQEDAADRLLVSMENRMACGVGACLVCSCSTSSGKKKVCKDGPVFWGNEVFGQ